MYVTAATSKTDQPTACPANERTNNGIKAWICGKTEKNVRIEEEDEKGEEEEENRLDQLAYKYPILTAMPYCS